ncbi:MAG: T9SS type A sorting domain-containing protein [Flavobacterium sp.]|uniref:T9SS type A sorting domain-containing protein n=1 Tax=Flavobacterium sp. TaxID=239 RepID=UPI003264B7A6
MKKNYLFALLALVVNLASAQIEPTTYRGAFAPAPTAMWTDSWTNWNPQSEPYTDAAIVVNVTTNINTNTTWTTGKTYKITGLIYVTNNATLTIQPGVVVKGVYSNTGTALVITKGAKLNAIGTAAAPIVFTSAKTAGTRAAGDWGGIILLGRAGFNLNSGINNIEGITATANTEYGGGASPIDADNSGSMKYCRIEFPGFVFSPNNEINGLTFGSVGSGTSIDYVQVSYSGDDSFEWFGGAVNCKHLVAYKGLDDDFDTDNGFKGIVQFALGVRDPSIADNPAISTSEGFESDNNAAGTTAAGTDNTSAIFTNCTLIGPSFRATLSPSVSVAAGYARAARLRRTTQLKVYNSIFMDFKNNFLFVDGATTVANANGGTLKFKNNIIAGVPDATFTAGVNPTSLNSWFASNNNSYVNGSGTLLTKAYGTSSSDYSAGNLTASPSNLDYRPGTTAATGADFSDSSLTQYITAGASPVVTNRVYCKGALATALTANLTTTGVSLLWYTVATGGTGSATAPTPLTSTVGVKNYWVSQIDTFNIESARVLLTVTVNALPTEVIGTITGLGPLLNPDDELHAPVYASATAVGYFVGTTSTFTYTIPAFTTVPTPTYVWTVPQGANITAGQGTNSITVNFLNVPYGAGTIGSIQVQAENASGCRTTAKTLSLTKALPTAPTSFFMNNKASATPNTAITTFGQFMGTTTPITLTAGYSSKTLVFPSSYSWELPTGVSLVLNGAVPVVTSVNYTAEPFFSPAAAAPTTVGTIYWTVTYNTYTVLVNGVSTVITTSTAVQKIVGGGLYTASSQAYLPYNKYGTVITSDKGSILVSFEGVSNQATTLMYFGVKALNGVGSSTTSNLTNADYLANNPIMFYDTYSNVYNAPVPPSTNATSTYTLINPSTAVRNSKLLKLTAALPTVPSTLVLTDPASATPTTAVTNVSKYVGTATTLTLTANTVATASSYVWELPTGVNAVNLPAGATSTTVGGVTTINSTTERSITINFLNVAPGTVIQTLYLGVKAKNGIGLSQVLTNGSLTPATTSTAKLLKVTISLPAIVSSITGQIAGVCANNTYNYTMSASPLATSYIITAPIGSVVTSSSNPTNATNILPTTDLSFSVLFPGNIAAITPKTIAVQSVNGYGSSATSKAVTITTAMPAISTVTGGSTFGRCATQTFSIAAVAAATAYNWTVANGAVIVSGAGTNSIEVDFSAVPAVSTTNVITVSTTNACAVNSTVKTVTLTQVICGAKMANNTVEISNVSEIYPNPSSSSFNLDVTSSKVANVSMSIFNFYGTLVSNKNVKLDEGSNTINENISDLKSGIYFVKFYNSSNNEIIVKKLIKN